MKIILTTILAFVFTYSFGQDFIMLGTNKLLHQGSGSNIFLGNRAGEANSTGTGNTFVGYYAGLRNTSGNSNIIIGTDAGGGNLVGNENVFIGRYAGLSNTDNGNTFIGFQCATENTIGTQNTFLGKNVGVANTTGSYNTLIGTLANTIGANLQRSAAIGYNARVSINDAIVLGDYQNANIKVGIGIHNPQYRLDVKGVINMRVGFNSPSLKINDKDFLALDKVGAYILSNFKLKYDNQNQWADMVFDSNNKLKSIEEVIEFTKKNKHLPNIPSAKEVAENGLDVSQILPKFLEKIEELTIYVHQISEENKKLKQEFEELKKKF